MTFRGLMLRSFQKHCFLEVYNIVKVEVPFHFDNLLFITVIKDTNN